MTSLSQSSPRLNLPLIQPSQASKHITHNEALLDLDTLLFLDLTALDATTPPNSDDGTCVTVGLGEEEFSGQDGKIACHVEGAWRFHDPLPGMTARLQPDGSFRVFDGTDWVQIDGDTADTLPQLGINTAPDAINRFAVKSQSVLFAADDQMAAPTGDIRLNLNRDAISDTATIGFQTDYQTTAELGLSGDGHFRIKTSDDTVTFQTALILDPTDNHVGLGELTPRYALDVYRDTPGIVERMVITNRAEDSGSGAAMGIYAGNTHSLTAIQYPHGTASLVSSGSNLLLRAQGSGGRVRLYSESQETLDVRPTHADFKVPPRLPSHTVSSLPSAATAGAGALIYVSDESQGACAALSDGQDWRRLRDDVIVS